jgi:hypothetical protein
VYYRWHPLFGLTLPVHLRSNYSDGERIYCQSPDGRICIMPNWMLDPESSHYSLGSPMVSVEALLELRKLLLAWQAEGVCAKASGTPSHKEETDEAKSEAAQPADESAIAKQSINQEDSSRGQTRGADAGIDGSAAQRGAGKQRAGIQGRKK